MSHPLNPCAEKSIVSLVDFFRNESGVSTPFTETFLSGQNMLVIQTGLTQKLRQLTRNAQLTPVEFTDAVIDALMTTAHTYRLAILNIDTLAYANLTLIDNLMPSLETRYYESAVWKRWGAQGIPDPNNIPLPIPPDTNDFTAETDSYMLSDPWGKPRPMW